MQDSIEIDDCIDRIVSTCNGDLRGALKALMLVNERLELELKQMSALVAPPAICEIGKALH